MTQGQEGEKEADGLEVGDGSTPADALAPIIVAIGASAGGLEALKQFFTAMLPHPRLAFVVIVHLSPHRVSQMAELLANATAMPVTQAKQGDEVLPGHVYVIPPNHYLGIRKGVLHLKETVNRPAIPMPIDHFMRALAEDQQGGGVGIVLTGADHDGTLGLKEIKAAGGLTIAQEPGSAQHPGMPKSALSADPDWVLPIDQMPQALVDYVAYSESDVAASTSPAPQDKAADPLQDILTLIRSRTGHDFRWYRPGMLLRRLQRRMRLKLLNRIDDYMALLRESDDEVRALTKDFLIGVTEFFREPEAWRALEEQVLPVLVQDKSHNGSIRVWSVGCATGEEAYSIAMQLLDEMSKAGSAGRLNVFATDVDQAALQIARAGCYYPHIEVTVPTDRLHRYFSKTKEHYKVRKNLREAILFAPQNVISDPPFSRVDLIICRNLFIYLEPPLQQKVLELFHFALNAGGYLFLGRSESLGAQAARFEPVSSQWRIYRSVGARARLPRDLPMPWDGQYLPVETSGKAGERRARDPAQITHDLLIGGHTPAAVLVTRDYRVLYFHGKTEQYLLQSGEPSWDLPSLARQGLNVKLRTALHRAVTEQRTVTIEASVKRGDGIVDVSVEVEPVANFASSGLLLVTFQDVAKAMPLSPIKAQAGLLEESTALRQMEDELRNTRRELQSAVEDLETANEELRVANEEAMSMNEELQSSNEELETSKEELQSLNEELTTVNSQLEEKLLQLEHTNNDLSNLLSSTHIPTLFLDRQFRIQRYTPSATRLFSLIPTDIGRPLSDIASRIVGDDLIDEARRVFADLATHESEVRTDKGAWFLRRVLPYRTEEDRIDGVVVTFVDITELRHASDDLRRLAAVVRDSNDAIVVYDFDGRILSWNRGAEQAYGYSEAEALNMAIADLVPATLKEQESALAERVRQGEDVGSCDTQRLTKTGEALDTLLTLSALRDESGAPYAIVSTERDQTERKRMEDALRESEERFRAMADSVPALIWMGGADRRAEFVNHACVEFTGQPASTLVGSNWLQLVHPEDVPRYTMCFSQAFAQRSRCEIDFRLRRADGHYRWMRSSSVPRYGNNGEFLGYIELALDIHERKLAEQAIAEADARKNEFLAMLAHELRNPLAPIRTSVEVISRLNTDNPKIQWATEVIARQMHQLSSLVDDLLDIARISRGKIVLHRQPLDVSLVIERACETSRPLIEARKHQLDVKLPDAPLYVEGDLLRLAQVVANLLGNAAKYTDDGGCISVTVDHVDDEICISVRDNGSGIAPEMLPQVFDLFSQANPTIDRSQGGLGIGLTLVQRLVQLHGGRVEARSAGLGQGSEFIVRLPLLKVEKSEVSPPIPASGPQSRPALRVLVVDDNIDAAESMSMLLEMEGHEVRIALDGEVALKAAEVFHPHVVVLDIGLPGMDGYEVARQLRSRHATNECLLIALTGYGQPEDAYRAKVAGFDHHLVKPVEPRALTTLITAQAAKMQHTAAPYAPAPAG